MCCILSNVRNVILHIVVGTQMEKLQVDDLAKCTVCCKVTRTWIKHNKYPTFLCLPDLTCSY